jgi:hypothetical protein
MLEPQQIEQLMTLAASLDREALIRQFRQYGGRFPIDFTAEFLQNEPLEHLRHIFVAVCLQNSRMPQDTTPPVAA